jgi:hypothetical protein
MNWYVVILQIPPGALTDKAYVVGPMTQQQFNQKYGANAQTGGTFHTKADAQAYANKYNQKPASAREVPGSRPFAPSVAGPHPFSGPKITDIFHGLNFTNWVLRIGELILGVVLVGVGIAKLTGVDNAIMKVAMKAGKLAVL